LSFAGTYIRFLCRRPGLIFAAAVALLVPSLWLAAKLELKTDFKDLLPKRRRSVTELERISKHVGGNSSLVIAVEGDDLAAMERYADDLAARLRALPPGLIDHVDESVRAERAFFERNRWLYASVQDLEKVRDAIEKRVIAETPFDLGLEEDDQAHASGTRAASDDLKALKRKLEAKAAQLDKFPGGYYAGENGHLLALFAYAAGNVGTDFDAAQRLLDRVRAEAEAQGPRSYHPSLRVTLTGDLLTGIEEYKAVKGDIFLASSICISLVLLVIVLFYGRLRSLTILGVTLTVGVGVTFGFARLTIGYLNTSTAFLGSIVAGNGINFAIVMLARYFEERRRGRAIEDAVDLAVRRTAPATGGAALAAGIAYGSLMLTDFRGFNQFGVIGGFGMLICWIAAYTVGPAMIVLCERIPLLAGRSERPWRNLFSQPFAAAVRRAPRALLLAAGLLSALGVVLTVRFLARDPFEYDFGKLRNNQVRRTSYAFEVSKRVSRIRGEGGDGLVLLAERPDQVPLIKGELERRRRAAGAASPIGSVTAVEELLPERQGEKLALLAHIRSIIDKSRDALDDEDRKLALDERPPETLRALTVADLPRKLTEPFTEKDGRKGRIVFIQPAKWLNSWGGHDLIQLARAVEELRLDDGETVYTSGQAVVFADMLRSVLADGPRAVACSLLGVLMLILALMRRVRASLLTLATLLCGTSVMLGLASVLGWRLNFLNFVAIPITLGVGADYAINMVRRHLDEPDLPPDQVVATTGGAVTLCSMTTIIGYSSLLIADNSALVSFGMLAALGEVTCLTTAVAFLPALVRLLRPRRAPASAADAAA